MGGKFVNKSASDLQLVAAKAAIAAGGLNPEQIDSVVIGHVLTVRFRGKIRLSLIFPAGHSKSRCTQKNILSYP